MSRSSWKGYFFQNRLLKKNYNQMKTWSRNNCIPEILIGTYVFIYNGKVFKKILITREKVGFKLGAFSLTKKHSQKKISVKKNLPIKKIKK